MLVVGATQSLTNLDQKTSERLHFKSSSEFKNTQPEKTKTKTNRPEHQSTKNQTRPTALELREKNSTVADQKLQRNLKNVKGSASASLLRTKKEKRI